MTKTKKETRSLDFEMNATDESSYIVEGYALTFDSPTVLFEDGDTKYYETIQRGCLDGVDFSDVVLNFNHNNDILLSRTKNNTLALEVDGVGLKIKADLSSTAETRKYYEMVKSGLVDKMSFAFTVKEDGYDRQKRTRTIKKLKKLYDVSLVTFPAYQSTSVSARDFFNVQKEVERLEEEQKIRENLLLLTYL